MGRRAPPTKIIRHHPTSVKFVKKASKWCRTSWVEGKQIQEWFDTEPKIKDEIKDEITETNQ